MQLIDKETCLQRYIALNKCWIGNMRNFVHTIADWINGLYLIRVQPALPLNNLEPNVSVSTERNKKKILEHFAHKVLFKYLSTRTGEIHQYFPK